MLNQNLVEDIPYRFILCINGDKLVHGECLWIVRKINRSHTCNLLKHLRNGLINDLQRDPLLQILGKCME